MSREVKRVPLDFDWEMDKRWQGYLMPEALQVPDCPECKGSGMTSARKWVEQITTLLLQLNTDLSSQAQGRHLHPYLQDTGPRAAGRRPSPDIAEFAIGLAGRGEAGRFHDAIDTWVATDKVIAAAGLDPEVWGKCLNCSGSGSIEAYEGQSADAEKWECTEPPVGEGWQLWETVSEGSPISPVFDSAENLAHWIADSKQAQSYESALKFVNVGWAPSMMLSSAGLQTGIDAIGTSK